MDGGCRRENSPNVDPYLFFWNEGNICRKQEENEAEQGGTLIPFRPEYFWIFWVFSFFLGFTPKVKLPGTERQRHNEHARGESNHFEHVT